MSQFQKVVAIDGPSGAGKSTVAKSLAEAIAAIYIDTGAMFRSIGLYFHKNNISFDDESSMQKIIEQMNFEYCPSVGKLVVVNGEDYTEAIRENFVSDLASRVSKIQLVRDFLLDFQRSLVSDRICVMEGRDIGTVVFPKAFAKFFVTGSVAARAKRRFLQLKEKGEVHDLEEIEKELAIRDERDSSRENAPLKCAEDAENVDTTNMSFDEVVEHLKNQVNKLKDKIEA